MGKNLVKFVCAIIFFVHFIFHILYLAPINPATDLYSRAVSSYMNSFFSQNWHLFAPEPAVATVNLNYRCSSQDPWKNFLQPLFAKHKSTLITSLGKQSYVYQHLTREVYNAQVKKIDAKSLPEFKILNRVISDLCQKENSKSKYFEFNTELVFTKNFSDRHKPENLMAKQARLQFNFRGVSQWNAINQ